MNILFVDAIIYDGTGTAPFKASVLVKPPRICGIYKHLEDAQRIRMNDLKCQIVNCEGKLAICPGFIDMHAHSDLSLLHTPSHLAKITQGVTFEVLGQDGIGYAPVDEKCLALIRQQIAGWNGNPSDSNFWRWRTMREYMNVLETSKIATNVSILVPQGNLRMLVLGYDPRDASPKEIDAMKLILRQALHDGAAGMSSGLTYVPGMYAKDSELAQLLEVVKEFNGYFCPHHRSYGKGAIQAYAEMIELARTTKIRLHLTHAILNFDENRGKAPELLQMLQRARSEGVFISLDSYPYLPGSTTLAAQLPSWAAAGGPAKCVERLKSTEELNKIRYDVEVVGTDGCHGCTVDWSTIEISGVSNPDLLPVVGKTIKEVYDQRLVAAGDEFGVMVHILVNDGLSTTILQHVGHETNVRAIMQDPFHCGGSDGILTSAKPHPRGYGCFTRYLGHYARDLPQGKERDIYAPEPERYRAVEPVTVFPGGLSEAIAHLTSRPAKVLRIEDRGVIKEGCFADLVVFNPLTVRDQSTYLMPQLASVGIEYVLVNGEIAVDSGKPTHGRFGKVVRLV